MADGVSRGVRAGVVALVAGATALAGPEGAGSAAPSQPAEDAEGRQVTAEPSTGLVDFQVVRVTGAGFEPYSSNEIFECRADAVDASGCDPDNAYFADADGAGVVRTTFPVDARIFDQTGRGHDCRSTAVGCKLGIGLLDDFSVTAFTALEFDPAVPLHPGPTVVVEPDTGLRDQQTVAVRGASLVPLFETFAYQCVAGRPRDGTTCNFDQDVRGVADEDGTLVLDHRVEVTLHPSAGGEPVDCTATPGTCVIELALGFSDRPDRFARAPITFLDGPGPEPTTSTTTSPPETPRAQPATPVVATPSYTG